MTTPDRKTVLKKDLHTLSKPGARRPALSSADLLAAAFGPRMIQLARGERTEPTES